MIQTQLQEKLSKKENLVLRNCAVISVKQYLMKTAVSTEKCLPKLLFSEEEKHEKLNSITHHYIMEEIKKWLYDVEIDGAKVAVIDAPLLFESGADSLCDITVGITAPYATRLKRIMKRDGIDKKSACLRLDSQPKDDFFEEKCDFILANNGSLKSFSTKANLLIGDILSKT